MSNDLISRSAVVKIIEDEIKLKSSYVEHNAQIDIMFKVKEMPTAYNVDKVVERLEVNSMFAHADDEPFVMLDDAVEIVKSGGIGTVGKEKNDGN